MQTNDPDTQQLDNKANQPYEPPQQVNPAVSVASGPTTIQPQQPSVAPSSEPKAVVQPSYGTNPAQASAVPVPPTPAPVANQSFVTSNADGSKFTLKKIGIILSIVVLLFVAGIVALKFGSKAVDVVSSGSLSGGVSLSEYTSQDFGFTIKVPEGWSPEVTNESFFQEVTFVEPVGDIGDTSEANSNYAILSVEQKDSTEREYSQKEEAEYFEYIKKGLQRGLTDQDLTVTDKEIATLESEEVTTINGNPAYKVKLRITNFNYEEGAVGYNYNTFVFIDKTKQYEITLTAHESEKPVLGKADEIINSFKTN